mmetsp:Transcript_37759/g.70751  ORF Transcript_37759/g.70751 Transcript_37759/m.70751 type:complete len:217 (-) Transcript_37759:1518-2168(-)
MRSGEWMHRALQAKQSWQTNPWASTGRSSATPRLAKKTARTSPCAKDKLGFHFPCVGLGAWHGRLARASIFTRVLAGAMSTTKFAKGQNLQRMVLLPFACTGRRRSFSSQTQEWFAKQSREPLPISHLSCGSRLARRLLAKKIARASDTQLTGLATLLTLARLTARTPRIAEQLISTKKRDGAFSMTNRARHQAECCPGHLRIACWLKTTSRKRLP